MDSEIPQQRGTGRTTKQMKEAPRGAVFVWCNDNLSWPRNLALTHGRKDLQIIGPTVLEGTLDRFRGTEIPAVVFDHIIRDHGLTPTQWRGFQMLRSMARLPPLAEVDHPLS